MTATAQNLVETAVPSGWAEGLAAAARHMYAAESFLHTARQAGCDEWVSVAYDHLRAATVEHVACLYGCSQQTVADTVGKLPVDQPPDYGTEIRELQVIFPQVPVRIVSAVFEAVLPLARTYLEAVQVTRERLMDALAA
jgi:hypothetical protein